MAKPPIRKPKKKVCAFCHEKISYVDYNALDLGEHCPLTADVANARSD